MKRINLYKSTFVATIACALIALCGCAHGANVDVKTISGDATKADSWLIAQTKTVVEADIPAGANRITMRGRTGKVQNKHNQGFSVSFLDKNGKMAKRGDGTPIRSLSLVARDMKVYGSDTAYPDAYIYMPRPFRYYVRPNVQFYKTAKREKLLKEWDKLPSASQHTFTLELRRDQDGTIQVWFDGNFVSSYSRTEIDKLRITLQPSAALESVSAEQNAASSLLALPIQQHSRVRTMSNAKIAFNTQKLSPELAPTFQKLNGESVKGIDVGNLSVIPSTFNSDLQSYYWRRSALDNLPEQRMFTVPQATYDYAYVLCATENDPKKVDAFTLRVTRYGRSRGNAMADTIVHVPNSKAKDSDDAKRVGTVSYGPDGARQKATLWLLKVPIKNGLIQDILYNDKKKNRYMPTSEYLDVELMDPLYNVEKAEKFPPSLGAVRRAYKPTNPNYSHYGFYTVVPAPQTSGVHVFAMALEKSAAHMRVNSNIGVQAFYASDKPQFEAKVTADKAGAYSVAWEYADVDDKIVTHDAKSLTLKAGESATVSIPVKEGNGWYAARFQLKDAGDNGTGNEAVDYRTSFVMLPPDTRKAGLESPYYGWWYGTNHGDDIELNDIGPLLKRAGIRRASGSGKVNGMTESATLPKYGFTQSTIPWTPRGSGRYDVSDYLHGKKTLAEAIKAQKDFIADYLKSWPSVDRMMVFHESSRKGLPFPSELWGETPKPLEGENAQTWQKRMTYLKAMAAMVRADFPQLKLQYGNSWSSLKQVGWLFREKFPRKFIDTIASEDLGQIMPPETDGTGGTQDGWYLRELAQKMGYGDVPVTANTEWIGRMTESLGLRAQAEWKVRDGLLALGYGYDTISIAGMNDASDGYYYSIYANGGLVERYPQMVPKPAYAAIATLTQVLDKAKFQRFVPTGSTVCYLEEFKREDKWVYVMWTPRGDRELTLNFANNTKRTLTDIYGRESTVSGKKVQLKASPSAQYLISDTKLTGGFIGKSTFPADIANVPKKPLQVIPLESVDAVKVALTGSDESRIKKSVNSSLDKVIGGNVEVRAVEDPEMGKCIEIELKPNPNVRLGETEFVTLQLAHPVKTTAKNAGLWIKGNGSWGKVDVRNNYPWGPWATNHARRMEWLSEAKMNFDGWNFVAYPYYEWVHKYSKALEVTDVRIYFPRTTLVGTQRMPVENQKIRIKSIVLW